MIDFDDTSDTPPPAWLPQFRRNEALACYGALVLVVGLVIALALAQRGG